MTREILICCDTGCLVHGAKDVVAEFMQKSEHMDVRIKPYIKEVGCNGLCQYGPLVTIQPDDITYYQVQTDDVDEILQNLDGQPVDRLLYVDPQGRPSPHRSDHPFYATQHKIALRNTGVIDPGSVEDYLKRNGYQGLSNALAMTPSQVIDEIELSGLRGRGGAGFPTARKWRSCSQVKGDIKYMLCNGDEGDPGAFMDRSLMEGDPHSVLEGLIIGAYAIGARRGFLYIRDEYGLAVIHIQQAIETARALGYLGDNILGSGFSFDCEIVRGGGAFVCGESSALMSSIEGKVGEPRVKYIRSVERGLFDQPTVLNNVETLANVPYILFHGGTEFAELGTENSKGTKVFSLVGKVNRTGLVEVPMGVTLRHLIFDIGGGIKGGGKFKGVQTGGPSGGCIPEELLDLPIDFNTLKTNGSMMGSGGMIVMDETTCMVELARYYLNFLAGESCGKCTPCREGLRCMLDILTRITEGNAEMEDLDLLEDLAYTAKEASLCELGRTAANPVMSTLKYFRKEYEAHIRDKRCPAGVCTALIRYEIDRNKCEGCGLCSKQCPAEAISGAKGMPYSISSEKCIKCGNCKDSCKFGAITIW